MLCTLLRCIIPLIKRMTHVQYTHLQYMRSEKKSSHFWITSFSILLGFTLSTIFLLLLYWVLQIVGLERQVNAIDKSTLVEWTRLAFTPKKFFRFFYNASIIFIPFSTIVLSNLIEKFIKNRKNPLFNFAQSELYIKRSVKFINKNHIYIVAVMLVVMLFNFGYLIETGIWINYYHHNFIIAPINDLFHGKHLLVDTFSQYGTLFAFVLYKIFQLFIPFSYMNLYLLFMIFTMIYFAFLYFFLVFLTKNKLQSLVGLYFIIGINTLFNYQTYPYSENYVWPGGTVLRYFFDIPVFFLILKNTYLRSERLLWIISGLVAFSILYNYETGLSLAMAFVALTLFTSFAIPSKKILEKFLFFIKTLIPLCLFSILFPGLFSLYTYVISGTWPHWSLFTKYVTLAHEGLSNISTPLIGWHLVYLLLYFLTLVVVIQEISRKKNATPWKNTVLASLAVYGLFLMNYYMGRSVNSNLTVVSIPGGILLFALLHEVSVSRHESKNLIRAILIPIIIVVCALTTYYLGKRLSYRWFSINEVWKAKKYLGNRGFVMVNYNEEGNITANNLLASVAEIKKLTEGSEKILLFSRYNTVILVMSEKTNILPLPVLEQVYYKHEVEEIKKSLATMKHKQAFMFVDTEDTLIPTPGSFQPAHDMFIAVRPYYEFYKHVGILDVYRLK